jgi:hypothetical protein
MYLHLNYYGVEEYVFDMPSQYLFVVVIASDVLGRLIATRHLTPIGR